MAPLSVSCIALDKVFIIAGPTASGKSTYAHKLAQDVKGVVLNGDSLQVYQSLEILTDQPSIEIQRKISHRLYGFLDPRENCTVGRWLEWIHSEIEKALKSNKSPIVVGGTGFYLKSLIEGISTIPSVDPTIRTSLEERPQRVLYEELQKVDPSLATRIQPKDRQRTLRGLEVFQGTGKPLSYWQSQKTASLPYTFEKILLMPSREETNRRIETRVEEMIEQGAIEEAKRILALPPSSSALKTIGLRELGDYLKGNISLEEAKNLMIIHTKQYAKRQRTWFRHQF